MSPFSLVLASRSSRRAELIRGIGIEARIVAADVSEEAVDGESPRALVARLAEAKGRSVADRVRAEGDAAAVLAADTVVVIDGHVLGKPRDRSHAGEMLSRLAGREHEVLTGTFLTRLDDGRSVTAVDATRVRFRPLDSGWIAWYVGTGEPMDKAGAYGIQGKGAVLTAGIDGSWSNVVGFPLERLPALFDAVGFRLLDFLQTRC